MITVFTSLFLATLCFSVLNGTAFGFFENPDGQQIVVSGYALCLDENNQPYSPGRDCPSSARRFGFRTLQGRLYLFRPEDPFTRMFTDPEVRRRQLEIKAWEQGEGELEIINLYSVRQGQRYELFYFCEVCNIKAFEPGPCYCCRDDFELREQPLSDSRVRPAPLASPLRPPALEEIAAARPKAGSGGPPRGTNTTHPA